MTDPEIQAAIDRAIEQLARRLAAVSSLTDPHAAARQWIEDDFMGGPDRWWPHPEPPGRRRPGTGDPPNDEFKQRLARLHNTPREDTP